MLAKNLKRMAVAVSAGGLLSLIAPAPTHALPIFSFEGTIGNHFTPDVQAAVQGQSFRFTYEFDPTTPDDSPFNPDNGSYLDAVTSATLEVGGFVWTANTGDIVVSPLSTPTQDNYFVEVQALPSFSGPTIGTDAFVPFLFSLSLSLPVGTFLDDSLPSTIDVTLADISQAVVALGLVSSTGQQDTSITAISLDPNALTGISTSAVSVPEPSTIAMFGIGLAGLGLLGWHARRRERRPSAPELVPA